VVDGMAGNGTALYRKVCEFDLEGVVAKRMSDPYGPNTKWFKVLNPAVQGRRAELFDRR
jgi:ATP-dependent DNA ligase